MHLKEVNGLKRKKKCEQTWFFPFVTSLLVGHLAEKGDTYNQKNCLITGIMSRTTVYDYAVNFIASICSLADCISTMNLV